MKHVKMSDLIFLVDLFNISFWYWEEHKLSKGCVLVEKGESVRLCGELHTGGKKVLTFWFWERQHADFMSTGWFFPLYKDEVDLRLHHFSKLLHKELEKDHFYEPKADHRPPPGRHWETEIWADFL